MHIALLVVGGVSAFAVAYLIVSTVLSIIERGNID